MMSMVERVARAIMAESQNMGALAHRVSGDRAIERRLARAAIEAMREPTDAILDAMNEYETGPVCASQWRDGIDAALNEQVVG